MIKEKGRAIFVTGTDTGVGKTIISCAMAASLKRKGANVGAMKPFETGCRESAAGLIPGDSLYLAAACSSGDEMDLINPYRFKHPLAPAVAAEMESVQIDIGRVASAFDQLLARHEYLIVEGVGGLLVPLKGNFTAADMITMLKVPALIVSRCSLGTINHTLLTVKCASAMGIKVAGVMMNQVLSGDNLPSKTNPGIIRKLIESPVFGPFPHLSFEGELADSLNAIADAIDAQLDVSALFER